MPAEKKEKKSKKKGEDAPADAPPAEAPAAAAKPVAKKSTSNVFALFKQAQIQEFKEVSITPVKTWKYLKYIQKDRYDGSLVLVQTQKLDISHQSHCDLNLRLVFAPNSVHKENIWMLFSVFLTTSVGLRFTVDNIFAQVTYMGICKWK